MCGAKEFVACRCLLPQVVQGIARAERGIRAGLPENFPRLLDHRVLGRIDMVMLQAFGRELLKYRAAFCGQDRKLNFEFFFTSLLIQLSLKLCVKF